MADTALRLVEKAVMDVVLSREGRRRYNNGDALTLDPSDLRDIVRLTMAKCATPPSPSTAPEVDERAAFEAWARDPIRAEKLPLERWPKNDGYKDTRTYIAYYGWKAGRAALAFRPAEVDDAGAGPGGQMAFEQAETRMYAGFQPVVAVAQDVGDEGLPPLPDPFENWDPRYEGLVLPVFTAEQYRQGQREAVAADRARRGAASK